MPPLWPPLDRKSTYPAVQFSRATSAAVTGSFNENCYRAAQRSMSLGSPSLKGYAIILDLVSPLNKGDTTNAVKIIFFDSLFWLKH